MANNTPQITVKIRRKGLLEKIMEGNSNANIKDWWMDEYQRTEHTFEKDMTWCYAKVKLFVNDNHAELIANHLMRYDRNAENAFDNFQFAASNQALQANEKLLGLHKPESQTFIQNNTISLEHLTDVQIDKIIEEAKLIEKE